MLIAGRYRLGEQLGRGGMGEVWRGHDEVLGRQVAVKLLLGDDGDESAAMRFRMEAQTAARLNHPQVVAVYDFGEWDGRFYLVMELVQGPSLAAELATHRTLRPERVVDLAAQAASGLAAAHRQGVVHRDVKPGNLMVDESTGALKIGDFGIARFVDETSAGLTRAGQIVGTSTYLAPERALGRTAGPESDVYALGCVLYQLLVGRPPFWDDSPTALLYMHVDSLPDPPRRHRPEVPQAFETYLLRMLAKAPEERPTAQQVADFFAGVCIRDSFTIGGALRAPCSLRRARASRNAAGDDDHVRTAVRADGRTVGGALGRAVGRPGERAGRGGAATAEGAARCRCRGGGLRGGGADRRGAVLDALGLPAAFGPPSVVLGGLDALAVLDALDEVVELAGLDAEDEGLPLGVGGDDDRVGVDVLADVDVAVVPEGDLEVLGHRLVVGGRDPVELGHGIAPS